RQHKSQQGRIREQRRSPPCGEVERGRWRADFHGWRPCGGWVGTAAETARGFQFSFWMSMSILLALSLRFRFPPDNAVERFAHCRPAHTDIPGKGHRLPASHDCLSEVDQPSEVWPWG